MSEKLLSLNKAGQDFKKELIQKDKNFEEEIRLKYANEEMMKER